MSERKEPGLNLSGLDIRDGAPGATQSARQPPKRAVAAPKAEKPRGGLLLTLILLVLAVGGGGLAYWTAGLKQSLDKQQAELAKAQQRLAEVEQLLALTSDTASQSGETLMGRLGQMEIKAGEKYEHFDSEIAKLWTIAYQRNKPQLEEQKKALEAQSADLEALKKSLADTSGKLDKLGSRVDSGLGDLSGIKKQVATLDSALKEQSKTLKSVSADVNFALSLEKDERVSANQALSARIDKLSQSAEDGSGLGRKIASIEQSIQAIDGSRRQFNQSLLQLRDQLNQLQQRLDGR